MNSTFEKQIERILRGLGINDVKDCLKNSHVLNCSQSKTYYIHGTQIDIEVCDFGNGNCRVDIDFRLPEGGVIADTFMDHCAAIEKTPKNLHHEYCAGPMYKDLTSENRRKHTFAYSPWGGQFFYIRSENYQTSELDEAVDNAITLAAQFARHLYELPSLRYWKTTDEEVIAKAKEIVANAALQETDCDREERAHYLRDAHSFIHGWFYPFNDRGKGTFDTLWPSSIDYAAKSMGNEGTFEYAVASLVLVDPDYIRKARAACQIKKETVTREF